MARKKILWVVNYDDVTRFVENARQYGATGVAIRTDNDVRKAIDVFHAAGMEVYGWRWPPALRDPAMKEAELAGDLFAHGLDGYYVDPGGAPGQPFDWDRPGLADLASEFCATVSDAANRRPFGVTSHYRARAQLPHLPWAAFIEHATVLLPQAYWHVDEGTVGHGDPADNYAVAIKLWEAAGALHDLIVPMAGALHKATPAEIAAYAAKASAEGVEELHFFADGPSVKASVRTAVRQAEFAKRVPNAVAAVCRCNRRKKKIPPGFCAFREVLGVLSRNRFSRPRFQATCATALSWNPKAAARRLSAATERRRC